MNKQELVARIAKFAGVSQTKANAAIDAMVESLSTALAHGESVTLVGFGTFSVATRHARHGRNPATGQPIEIPARKAPRFRPGKTLKDAVNV